jgi:putative Holliday junction resolvase
MRRGVRVALDIGDARIGVASSDPHGILATPVETVRRGPGDLDRIASLVAELEAFEIVIGLPRSLSGGEGPAAVRIRETAAQVAEKMQEADSGAGVGVGVRLVDERFTTVTAERMLRERGKKGSKRRAVVDQAAAVVILQHALDFERETGDPPGRPL